MSNVTQTFRGTATLEFPSTPRIINHTTSATPSTETSESLTSGTKQILIRCRGVANVQFAFTATESGTTFITIPKGSALCINDINLSGSIYLQADKASQVVEILEWSA